MHYHSAPPTSRTDLHVHSRYSDRPSEWILRRLGSPECFVEPEEVYRRAKAAGMDFVTISDHNEIAGALEIAHHPDVFISCESTTYFPENGAKLHVLALGLDEERFGMIQELRTNVYELRDYFLAEGIAHSVAHPLFLVNDKLTVDQLEKVLVLFDRFELVNGTRDPRAAELFAAVVGRLTPGMMAEMADRHGLTPASERPWVKQLTGGSDDHSGLYVGSAHTVTPEAVDVGELLEHLARGDHRPGGRSGSSVHLAHCFYQIAYSYYRHKILGGAAGRPGLLGKMLETLLDPHAESPGGLKAAVGGWLWRGRRQRLSETERLLVDEVGRHLRARRRGGPGAGPGPSAKPAAVEAFETSCLLAHGLSFAFGRRFLAQLGAGDLMKSLEAVSALGPVVAAITPYLAAFQTQHKDLAFLERVGERFAIDEVAVRGTGHAWLTDTFDDVNGVAHTVRSLAALACRNERELTVVTCLPEAPEVDFDHVNFQPVGRFPLPEYESLELSFPPFLEIFEYVERRRFRELILSTPGPLGLAGLAAAKLLQLETVGIYHTDFPRYVAHLTEDPALEAAAWRYMVWFFDACDRVLVPSACYRDQLVEQGLSPDKIRRLGRGVEAGRFSPVRRDPGFWPRHGGRPGAFTFLYVGRLSREKNLALLLDAWQEVAAARPGSQLAIVGQGPFGGELARRAGRRGDVLFTGYLTGDELATAYASSDLFVFPSTTDTFGNAVLEALSSGLPAIVSSQGGPREIVERRGAGVVVDLADPTRAPAALARTMIDLAADPEHRRRLARAGRRTGLDADSATVLDSLLTPERAPEIALTLARQAHRPPARLRRLAAVGG